jgi:UDP-glucuronate 4-epimerase
MKHALVTGGAGFIGSHLVDRFLAEGWRVTVVDNFDPFYDPAIKEKNIEPHLQHPNYVLVRADIRDLATLKSD